MSANRARKRSRQQTPTDTKSEHQAADTGIGKMSLGTRLAEYIRGWIDGWNRFWFASSDPSTLGLIRILAGSMLVYTHLIWGKDLLGFFGPNGRLPTSFTSRFYGDDAWSFSYLNLIDGSPAMIWGAHIVALAILLCFTLGLFTRTTGILAFLITVSYANRAAGALFGLDQINGFLALYLALGPSGAAYSLDRWIRRRRSPGDHRASASCAAASSGATMSVRLIQIHMCVVYLFAGLGKLQGETWWNGEAFWGAVANAEYQSMDLTWLASYPWLVNLATQVTVCWEVSYAALIWPSRTRPIVLALAIPLHLGIALGMGMMTFGLVMLIANLAFIPPDITRNTLSQAARLVGYSGQGRATKAS